MAESTSRRTFSTPCRRLSIFAQMSFYRDTYLKSEEWRTLRDATIYRKRARCQLCGHVSKSNDVHHVVYRRIWDVRLNDLRVLCRNCHTWVHALLERYPRLSKLPKTLIWKTIQLHYTKQDRYLDADVPKNNTIDGLRTKFGISKAKLFRAGLICKKRMRAWDWVVTHPEIKPVLRNPELLLEAYIKHANDPRRLIPALYSQLGNPHL